MDGLHIHPGSAETPGNSMECDDDNSSSPPEPIGMEAVTAAGFKTLIEATKSSNKLPLGKSHVLYSSYPSFHNIMKNEANNVLSKLFPIMKQAGCKGNIQRRDHEEKFEMVVETNDNILERVGMLLGEVAGINKNVDVPQVASRPQGPISGSWNKHSQITPRHALSIIMSHSKNIEKPQLNFKEKVNNDRNGSFEPKIKYKPNMLKPLAIMLEEDNDGITQYCHPYEFEIEHFKPNKQLLSSRKPIMYKPLDKTPLNWIETLEGLNLMLSDIRNYTEIAIDLEAHSYRSFQGITCLMQVSTRDTDYILDTLLLRDELQILNEVFTDPKVVKVFHGAQSDIPWLQRDFSLYVVNMFDTYHASKRLGYPQLSLAYLLKHFCGVNAQKHYQLADWRVRPLSNEMMTYAREDTHYLLYIYDNLRNALIEKANGQTNLLQSTITESCNLCLSRYVKPIWNPEGYMEMYNKSKKLFDNRQLYALKNLFAWRDETARILDESTGYVLPNHMLLHISESVPRETQGILACCNPIPVLVRQNLNALHKIILQARQQPLVKPVFEERRLYRPTTENDLTVESPLRCPHDLTHEPEFRDDLPSLLGVPDTDRPRVPDLASAKPFVTVFELNLGKKKSKLLKKTAHLTPFERYKQVKPFTDSQLSTDARKTRPVWKKPKIERTD